MRNDHRRRRVRENHVLPRGCARRRLIALRLLAAFASVSLGNQLARGDIFEWDWIDPLHQLAGKYATGTVVPGGAGVSAVPGADLQQRNLSKAYLISADLNNANLRSAVLDHADLTGANLNNASLMTHRWTGAVLSGASILNANFANAFKRSIEAQQLYSTSSYQDHDLRGIGLGTHNLSGWNFSGQNLAGAEFGGATLTGANFSNANLTGARFASTGLNDADLTGAVIRNADFSKMPLSSALRAEQVYSTASYAAKDLRGIVLGGAWINWNLSGQNLSGGVFTGTQFSAAKMQGADLSGSVLRGAMFSQTNLTDANLSGTDLSQARFTTFTDLTGANFVNANISSIIFSRPSGFTSAQLYATASYQQRNLRDLSLDLLSVSGWSFARQDLTGTIFSTDPTGADFTDAVVTNVTFVYPMSAQQLYSTANYKVGNLHGIVLAGNLAGFDLSSLDLRAAGFGSANLGGANLWDAMIHYTDFTNTPTNGFSQQQLMKTASYKLGNIEGIVLARSVLDGWQLVDLNLSSAAFYHTSLLNTDFSHSSLTGATINHGTISGTRFVGVEAASADFSHSNLTEVDLSHSRLVQSSFAHSTISRSNFAIASAASTNFQSSRLDQVDFSDADLRYSRFAGATLSNVTFDGADLRGATGLGRVTGSNTILPDATVSGIYLSPGEQLTIRGEGFALPTVPASIIVIGNPAPKTPITVTGEFVMEPDSTLNFILGSPVSRTWAQTLSFSPDIPIYLGGMLRLMVQSGINPATVLGDSFQIFDWTGVSPVGEFTLSNDPGIEWDTSLLYSHGIVRLVDVPEPHQLLTLLSAVSALLSCRPKSRRMRFAKAMVLEAPSANSRSGSPGRMHRSNHPG